MDVDDFHYYSEWNHFANQRRYAAPADPRRLVWIDPAGVDRYTDEIPLLWGLGRVRGGDWDADEHCNALAETTTYEGLVQRFEEGRDWEDTVTYQRAEHAFEVDGTYRGYDSLDQYREVRLPYVDDLYRSIAADGYRPNAEATHDAATDENRFEDAYVHHVEPLVAIRRDGECLLTEGYHRFCIARIQGLDEIPVQVLCRHERWQRVRDRLHETDGATVTEEFGVDPDHPDLSDLRS
jgi:hypothetical protein